MTPLEYLKKYGNPSIENIKRLSRENNSCLKSNRNKGVER